MGELLVKLREVLYAVAPVTVLVFVLSITAVPLETAVFLRFLLGALFIVAGLTLFLIGVDKGIAPLGRLVGETITKTGKLVFLIVAALVLGFFITLAEPGLIVFADQIELVTGGVIVAPLLIGVVSVGLAMLLAFAFYRIVINLPLRLILLSLYVIIFVLTLCVDTTFIIFAFDASGATTGVLATPFILALAFGLSHLKRDSRTGESDSFGTIAIVSAGAIIAVLILGLFHRGVVYQRDAIELIDHGNALFAPFGQLFFTVATEVVIIVSPLIVIFLIFQRFFARVRWRAFVRIMRGFVYAGVGLILFLLGVYAGFMDVGRLVGATLASHEGMWLIVGVAFVLGLLTILAEPAVVVLTHQIEDVTSGYVTRSAVLIALALGVGCAVALSALRVYVEPLQIWHLLLPGYALALGLMFIVPRVFVGMAFDAGGVATGPMTATFILAFMQGAAATKEGADVILDGFGMIALVALVPILTLEAMGLIFRMKSKKEGIPDESNA